MFRKSIFIVLLSIIVSQADQSTLSFYPSSLDVAIDTTTKITVCLSNANFTERVTIQFFYDDKENPDRDYIKRLPNITFNSSTESELKKDISIVGQYPGHFILTAKPIEINVSANNDFILIDVSRNQILSIFIQIVGWIYFVAWSISFYPQIYLNYKRSSVIGLNFDFLALNILGHSCYSVFNLSLYISSDVQKQYYEQHPHGVLPVLLNDVIFSCHAVFACLVTVIECLIFDRGQQRVSHVARGIGALAVTFLSISTIVSLSNRLSTLTLIYYFSYVKLAITIIKYVPQAWMNFVRKSTEGWSIGNILLDFTGGVLSLLQMFFLAIDYNDWSSIFGSPTKFGLGFFSVLFDILFIVQHYGLYRNHGSNLIDKNSKNAEIDENSPIIQTQTEHEFA